MRISDWSSDVCSSDLFQLCRQLDGLLPIFQRNVLIHERKALRCLRQAGIVRSSHPGVGALPVFSDILPVNESGSQYLLASRFASSRWLSDQGHGFGALYMTD